MAGWLEGSAAEFEPVCTAERLAAQLAGMSIANAKAVLQAAADRAADRSLLEDGPALVSLADVRAARETVNEAPGVF